MVDELEVFIARDNELLPVSCSILEYVISVLKTACPMQLVLLVTKTYEDGKRTDASEEGKAPVALSV